MELAPVVLFVYNRPWHTEQTLNALAQNHLAKHSVLYIFADGPKESASAEQLGTIGQVRSVIRNEIRFKQVILKEAETNAGLAESIIAGVTEVVGKHGKVIVLEDDMVTSPGFLTYMNDGLEKFSGIESIGSINAYADFAINFKKLPHYFLLNGADCWGWATWADRWKEFISDPAVIKQQLTSQNLLKEFDYGSTIPLLDDQINGKINSWHIRWHGSQVLHGRMGLFPKKSFLINIGFDGSGTHPGGTTKYSNIKIADLNLYERKLAQANAQSLLDAHQHDEAEFKKQLFKQFRVSTAARVKNGVSWRIRSLFKKIINRNVINGK